MTKAQERYQNDPVFSRCVDMIRYVLHENHMSPSEIREAVMVAVFMEEIYNPKPVIIRMQDFANELIKDQKERT